MRYSSGNSIWVFLFWTELPDIDFKENFWWYLGKYLKLFVRWSSGNPILFLTYLVPYNKLAQTRKSKISASPLPQQPKCKTFSEVSASTFHCRYNSWYFCRVFSFQILGSKGKIDFVLNNYFDLSKFKNWVQIFFFPPKTLEQVASGRRGVARQEDVRMKLMGSLTTDTRNL